MIDRLFFRIQI